MTRAGGGRCHKNHNLLQKTPQRRSFQILPGIMLISEKYVEKLYVSTKFVSLHTNSSCFSTKDHRRKEGWEKGKKREREEEREGGRQASQKSLLPLSKVYFVYSLDQVEFLPYSKPIVTALRPLTPLLFSKCLFSKRHQPHMCLCAHTCSETISNGLPPLQPPTPKAQLLCQKRDCSPSCLLHPLAPVSPRRLSSPTLGALLHSPNCLVRGKIKYYSFLL